MKKTIIICTFFILICFFTGCNSPEVKVYGDGLINYVSIANKNENRYLIPFITNTKIKGVKLFSVNGDNVNQVTWTLAEGHDCIEYSGWYINFVVVSTNAEIEENEEYNMRNIEKSITVKSITFILDGIKHTIKSGTFKLMKLSDFKNDIRFPKTEIITNGDTPLGYQSLENAGVSYGIECAQNLTIKKIYFVDAVKIKEIEINGVSYDSNEVNIKCKKNEKVDISFSLDPMPNIKKYQFVYTNFMIEYAIDSDKRKYVYIPISDFPVTSVDLCKYYIDNNILKK